METNKINKKNFIYLFLFISSAFIIFNNSSIIFQSLKDTLNFSLNILYPAIFPFSFLFSAFSLSSCSLIIYKLISPLMKLLKLPEAAAHAFFGAVFFGYSIGAKLTSELLKEGKIRESDALRLSFSLFSPGLPFCLLFAGTKIYGSVLLGFYLFISITIANLCILILTSLNCETPIDRKIPYGKLSFFEIINTSFNGSVKGILNLSLYTAVFRCIFALFNVFLLPFITENLYFIPSKFKAAFFAFFFEVTEGLFTAAKLNLNLIYVAFGLSFGGLAGILQSASILKCKFKSLMNFLLLRLSSAVFSSFIFSFFKIPQKLISVSYNLDFSRKGSENYFGVLLLTLLFLFYLIYSEKQRIKL